MGVWSTYSLKLKPINRLPPTGSAIWWSGWQHFNGWLNDKLNSTTDWHEECYLATVQPFPLVSKVTSLTLNHCTGMLPLIKSMLWFQYIALIISMQRYKHQKTLHKDRRVLLVTSTLWIFLAICYFTLGHGHIPGIIFHCHSTMIRMVIIVFCCTYLKII